ncbi:MAG: Chromosome-partitioning ATPase protein [Ignavibacteria bacterium]|nr:MAG: Chromosome-partitioning ATPase protein [Ignavibacteria bacterium]KAF0160398.1 MAG: Chromosome-partitioning ATPase protein [Ignavibacteria bacterium]
MSKRIIFETKIGELMASISQEQVLNALRKVNDPDLHKDLVTLNMIKDIKIDGSNISVVVELTTPACPLKDKIQQDCLEAIKKDVPAAKEILVKMDARVQPSLNQKMNSLLPGVKNTIAVASGKGGVGKSTVAVNLAVALAMDGAKVGLIDADIYGPSVPLMFGLNEKPRIFQDTETAKMVPLENYGVKLMSIGFLIDDNAPVIWRGPMASGAIKQFMSDVRWDELDYLIFDLPPGTGDIQLTLVQTIPLSGAVVVTTPQEASVIDVKKAIAMFQRVNVPVLGIVENMSYFLAPDTGKRYDIFGTDGGKKLAEQLSLTLLGQLPINQNIREGGDKGKPVVFDQPDSEQAKQIFGISRNLAAEVSKTNFNSSKPKIEISLEE